MNLLCELFGHRHHLLQDEIIEVIYAHLDRVTKHANLVCVRCWESCDEHAFYQWGKLIGPVGGWRFTWDGRLEPTKKAGFRLEPGQ